MSSFFEMGMRNHLGEKNQIVKLGRVIDWNRFKPYIANIHKENGLTGYDPLKMLKSLILGQ